MTTHTDSHDEERNRRYIQTYGFETVLQDWHDTVWLKAIAVNLGHTSSKVFDSIKEWFHCSPKLLESGIDCASAARRVCKCGICENSGVPPEEHVGHDHLVFRKECSKCGGYGGHITHEPHTREIKCTFCNGTGYIEPYDIMIAFVYKQDRFGHPGWNVSLYSTKPGVDCGAIAKSFGGGCHNLVADF